MKIAKDIRTMTEPELREYFDLLMGATKAILPSGVADFAILVRDEDNVIQFAATMGDGDLEAVARSLADNLRDGGFVGR